MKKRKPYIIVVILAIYAVSMAGYAYFKGIATKEDLLKFAPVMIFVLGLLYFVNKKKEKYRQERFDDGDKNVGH